MIGAHVNGINERGFTSRLAPLAPMRTWLVAQAPPAAAACGSGLICSRQTLYTNPYLGQLRRCPGWWQPVTAPWSGNFGRPRISR